MIVHHKLKAIRMRRAISWWLAAYVAFVLLISEASAFRLGPTTYAKRVKDGLGLGMISASEESRNSVVSAHDALKSPKMAKTFRRHRSARGREATTRHVRLASRSTTNKQKASKTANEMTPRTQGMDLPYNSTLSALRAYHTQNGDLILPRRFTVPPLPPFPPEWHGIDLATTVYNMRWWQKHVKNKPNRVAELNALAFCWERLQPEWNLVLQALVAYGTQHGDLLVKSKFVVPYGNATWPTATWGIPLGSCVYRIRSRNDFLRGANGGNRRDQLDRLGFVWDVHEHRFQKFADALRQYARLNECGPFSSFDGPTKTLKVPSTFVVPENDERWPKELWGFPLGVKCNAVRQKELYVKNKPRRRRILQELGFRMTGNADLGWLSVVHAAAIYSSMHDRVLDVPFHYVVPSPQQDGQQNGDPWPEYLWGFPLGQRLKDVRLKGAYLSGKNGAARRRQLDTLGFDWTPKRGRRKRDKS